MSDNLFLRKSFKLYLSECRRRRTTANASSHLALLKTEKRLFKENILSAVTSNPSFIKDDYLGAFQIFQIAKFSKSDEPSDDDKDFWCPMFETISPLKIGFLVNLAIIWCHIFTMPFKASKRLASVKLVQLVAND